MIWFLQFFFIKRSNNFFAFKINNNICPWHSIFNFSNHVILFRPIWKTAFCKNIFIYWYSNIIPNFKFRIFLIIFFIAVKLNAWLYINRLHFNYSMISIAYLLTILSNLQYTYFLISKSCIYKSYSLWF